MTPSIETTAVFLRPFRLPRFAQTLPAGEYENRTQFQEPVGWIEPGRWAPSVLVSLGPRASRPGLDRALTVPRAEPEQAGAGDKVTGRALTDFFLEEMLADPLIRLVMRADGVAEQDLRDLYAPRSDGDEAGRHGRSGAEGPRNGLEAGQTGPRSGRDCPGIGERDPCRADGAPPDRKGPPKASTGRGDDR